MPELPQYRLWCAFSDKLSSPFPITCTPDYDIYYSIKEKIRDMGYFNDSDIDEWILYQPGRAWDMMDIFIPEECDQRLSPRFIVQRGLSKDRLDIVVVVQRRNGKKDIRTVFGRTGLPCRPPIPNVLFNTSGRDWDYQESPELIDTLHSQISRQHRSYKKGRMDKMTIPLYLFLSGVGTGESRNAAELHETAYKCFNGTYPEMDRNDEIAERLQDPIVFHISLEKVSIQVEDVDPWKAIGYRMLLQLLNGNKTNLYTFHRTWNPPLPEDILSLLVATDGSKLELEKKTIILIVDGLQHIPRKFDDASLQATLARLGDFAQQGFRIVCGTSSTNSLIDRNMFGSSRRTMVVLPCAPLQPPTIDNKPIFNTTSVLERVLVEDCGEHGHELEILLECLSKLTQQGNDIGSEMKAYIRDIKHRYMCVVPQEKDAVAIVKTAPANRYLKWDEYLPRTQMTPDDICRHGLVRFTPKQSYTPSLGRLDVPYIWLLLLHDTFPRNEFFAELQLLDYRELRAIENQTLLGSSP